MEREPQSRNGPRRKNSTLIPAWVKTLNSKPQNSRPAAFQDAGKNTNDHIHKKSYFMDKTLTAKSFKIIPAK
jgi:hypothetical protein